MKRIWVSTALAFSCSILLAGCNSADVETTTVASPKGYYAAIVETRDRGSCCSPSASITLRDTAGRIGDGDLKVFEGTGGWPVKVHWSNPTNLIVAFCGGSKIKVESSILENKEVERTGVISRVTVQVVTQPDTFISGKAYCLPSR